MNLLLSLPASLALLAADVTSVPAPGLAVSAITVGSGTVWQVPKANGSTEGFLTIHNEGGGPDTLTSWSCSVADTTTMVGADGKTLQNLPIPADKSVTLSTSGPHLVLTKVYYTIDEGSQVPCALKFQNAGQIGVLLNATPRPKPQEP